MAKKKGRLEFLEMKKNGEKVTWITAYDFPTAMFAEAAGLDMILVGDSAEENLRYANLGFEEGVIPALNLMEAQTAWVSARSQLIDAQIEVKLTEVYLRKALGKLTK